MLLIVKVRDGRLDSCLLTVSVIDLVNEEFFANVYELTVYDPGIQLVEEHSVAAEKDLREHVLDDRIAASALLVEAVQDLTSPLALLFDFEHEVQQGREHLEVDRELLLQREHSHRSVFQKLLFDRQDVLLVDSDQLVDSRTERLDVDAMELLLVLIITPIFLMLAAVLVLLQLLFLLALSVGQVHRQLRAQPAVSIHKLLDLLEESSQTDYLVDHQDLSSGQDVSSLVDLLKVF